MVRWMVVMKRFEVEQVGVDNGCRDGAIVGIIVGTQVGKLLGSFEGISVG